jgi:hypothetical protein
VTIYRKSASLEKPIKGNASKHEAYREAWLRIRLAQENGFFLEAITIQESIISDRLTSYLTSLTASKPKAKTLSDLIRQWRAEVSKSSSETSSVDLIDAVNEWRKLRNDAVHAIVKSDSDQTTQSINLFLEKAKKAAEQGERLAREVTDWCRKEKRKATQNS